MNIQVINLLLSFVITVIIGLIVLPKLKKLKIGQVVREDGPKSHLSKNDNCSDYITNFIRV